jgi:low temperature requirement protein LtrA
VDGEREAPTPDDTAAPDVGAATAAVPPTDDRDAEHRVTPLELFFDLVLVFALTQVTGLLADDPTWSGVLRGMLVLAALWWAWHKFAWLTSALDVDEGGVRLAMLAAMGAMFFVALAVPGAFGRDAVLFGCSYLVVRLLHLALSATVTRADPDQRSSLIRTAPTAVCGGTLLVVAGFLDGHAQLALWGVALSVDYFGSILMGIGHGWWIAAEHFAERHGLVILIALGESVVAIGVGVGTHLESGALVAAALAIVLVSALWWLYFDVAALFARRRLAEAGGVERARLARDSYGYLHLPLVAGISLIAFGVETTLHDVDASLDTVPAVALWGGAALYLLGHIAFLFRTTRHLFRRRTIATVVLLATIPLAGAMASLAALATVTAVCVAVVAYEAIHHRVARAEVRHPEASG